MLFYFSNDKDEALILNKYNFNYLFDIFEQQPEVVSGEGFTKEGGSKDTEEIDAMQTRVEDLKLSSRTVNALTKANIYTVENIVGKTADELLDHEGIGEKALTEIQRAIGNLGIILKQEE